jgi:hypothetical protein
MLFAAKVFFETDGGNYRQFLTINKKYYIYDLHYIEDTFQDIFKELIEAISIHRSSTEMTFSQVPKNLRYLLRDSASFEYLKDIASKPLDSISKSVRKKWSIYPITTMAKRPYGVYPSFDHFRKDSIIKAEFQLNFDSASNLYKMTNLKSDAAGNWSSVYSVSNGDAFFIHLFENFYLRLNNCDNSFCFYVPDKLPDMYSLLSINSLKVENANSSSGSSSGNFLADLAGIMLETALNAPSEKAQRLRILKSGKESKDYRSCFIDMDSGDIIY